MKTLSLNAETLLKWLSPSCILIWYSPGSGYIKEDFTDISSEALDIDPYGLYHADFFILGGKYAKPSDRFGRKK